MEKKERTQVKKWGQGDGARSPFQELAFLRALRGFAVIVLLYAVAGCVPLRQGAREGAPVREKPREARQAAKGAPASEAWKNEMEGLASWYGDKFHGRLTASGEVYDMHQLTAAHKTLPLGTVVKVHNLENGKSVEVRVNDRGPFVAGRVIDLSKEAARVVGLGAAEGLVRVRLEVKRWP